LFKWVENLVGFHYARKAVAENPVLGAALAHSAEIVSNEPVTKILSQKMKEGMGETLFTYLTEIFEAPDPILECREKLAASMFDFARYQVIILPPPPEEDPTQLRGQPGISGELKAHRLELAKTNEGLKTELYGVTDEPTDDLTWDWCLIAYYRTYWWLSTFNVVRIGLKDCNEGGPDWYMPFMHAQCAYAESKYRNDIGWESAIDGDTGMAGVMYATFANFVETGSRYPDLEWREHYKDSIANGSLPLPNFSD
jgi:hypothetical protein